MFLFLINEEQTATDTTFYEDSTAVDTIVIYEVPDIISMEDPLMKTVDRNLCLHYKRLSSVYYLSLTDAFLHTPFMLYIYGIGQFSAIARKGYEPHATAVYWNYHRLDDPLRGSFYLSALPIQFLEYISVGTDIIYPSCNTINAVSKVNRYDRPFSHAAYTTGSFRTSMYTADFTRPITNHGGFYLSGFHWNSQGYRENDNLNMSAFYAHAYYNQIVPARLDILYASSECAMADDILYTLDRNQSSTFIDGSLVSGYKNHTFALYHNQNIIDYKDTVANISARDDIRTYGFTTVSAHDFTRFEVLYSLSGSTQKVTSDLFGSHSINTLRLWAKTNMRYNNIIASVSALGESRNFDDVMFTPRIALGLQLFDSVYVTAAAVRGSRLPSLRERYAPDTIDQWCRIRGNENLGTEHYWEQSIGFTHNHGGLAVYKIDFSDRILPQPDTGGYYTFQTVDSWQTIGGEAKVEVPLYIHRTSENTGMEVTTGFSGNYVLRGDSFPYIPKDIASLYVMWERHTDRFTMGLMALARFVGMRKDIHGDDLSPFKVFSLAGTLRFITLSCTARCDNIFDETYSSLPDYPLAPRTIAVSIKWEFWD
jgi:outer membrane cobalamin receptor